MRRPIRIALLGCGTVGRGFVELVRSEQARIAARYGVTLELARILVRDPAKERGGGIDRRLLTSVPAEAINATCDVVVELVGGVDRAGGFVRRAIHLGRDVVTANKALLARHGRELKGATAARGLMLGFEASVCGGIPVIRALERGLAGDSVESIAGIVNGTCNFILTRMEEGLAFDDALRLAQELGFAEADPSLDVDGHDAAQKTQILAELAFDAPVLEAVVGGIRDVTHNDFERARDRNATIRHVARAERTGDGVLLRVGVEEMPLTDPLASVRDEQNAVRIRGRAVGEMLLTGRGAGSLPTAAAVLSDVIEIARTRAFAAA